MTLRYRIVDVLPPDVGRIADAGTDVECDAYGEEPEAGSAESRSGDVICSLKAHEDGPHWDQWDRVSWELAL